MNTNKYKYRKLARVVIQTLTPLAIGSGEKDIMTDALVSVDVNGLPYIPGTSLAGILRHSLGIDPNDDKQNFLGYQKGKSNHGSEVIISDAKLLDANGIAVDGLRNGIDTDNFLKHYLELPIRQHVRLSHKGTAEDAGKFDEQVVFKGSRFCFSIEVWSDSDNNDDFKRLLNVLNSPELRIGSGSRKGFGAFRVVSSKWKPLNLTIPAELKDYLDYDTNLSSEFDGDDFQTDEVEKNYRKFKLELKPDDFFFFSSGLGDDDADNISVKEDYVKWNDNNNAEYVENGTLIPASSLKGAIAHRVAYFANKELGYYADKIDDVNEFSKITNPVVSELFGCAGKGEDEIRRGKVLFSDIVENPLPTKNEKLINHVSIDRFTGGAIDGHLFTERVSYAKDIPFETTLLVHKDISDKSLECLKMALENLCDGLLPLGGGTAKGYGLFTAKLFDEKNDLIYPIENE